MGESAFKGLVQLYTGRGKGKSTAALGLALRACGQGLRVCLIQFIKAEASGELLANERCHIFDVLRFGRGFVIGTPTPEARQAAAEGLTAAAKIMRSGSYDLVIFDEINNAVAVGLLDAADVVRAVTERSSGVEVVLTGRDAPAELLEMADLVTVMEAVRHPYDKGIPARKGIEY